MKKLEIIVRPGAAAAVSQAIEAAGYPGITNSQAEGHGTQKGMTQGDKNKGAYRLELVPKVRLEVVIPDSALEEVIEAVVKSARTGQPGDGKIFVSDIQDVIRIRTGERGDQAA
jgi:nitrogen regulatory protein P-II 1